jgi:hypothetical protein
MGEELGPHGRLQDAQDALREKLEFFGAAQLCHPPLNSPIRGPGRETLALEGVRFESVEGRRQAL